jgi:hypothetical protein
LLERRDSARGLVAREETNNNSNNSNSNISGSSLTKISESSSALRIKDMPKYASERVEIKVEV